MPRNALANVLNAYIAEYLERLGGAMHDAQKVRVWSHEYYRPPTDAIEFSGGMTYSKEYELNYLLESGFAPISCRYLNECLENLVRQELDTYVDKL